MNNNPYLPRPTVQIPGMGPALGQQGLGGMTSQPQTGPTVQASRAPQAVLNLNALTGKAPGPTVQAANLVNQVAPILTPQQPQSPTIQTSSTTASSSPTASKSGLAAMFADDENLSAKDKYLALMMAGFGMAEAGGTPGATFLGSLGKGGTTFGSVLSQLDKQNAAKKAAAAETELKKQTLGIQKLNAMAALKKAGMPTDKLSKLLAARDALPEDDPRRSYYDNAISKETTVSNKTSLGKLIEARDALDPNDPNRALFDAAIKKKTDSEGWSITTNLDGTTTIQQGPLGKGDELGSSMTKDLQDSIVQASGYLDQIRQMEYMFDPEMMQVPNRLWLRGKALGEKFDIADLSEEDRFELEKFNSMKSDSQTLLSAVIKELAGAAVSTQEQARIEGFLPTFGTGIFDGDGPSEFQDKMKKFMSSTESAIMRKKMYLKGDKPITGPQSYSFPLQIANPETKRMMWFSDFSNLMREQNVNAGIGEPSDQDIVDAWQQTVKTLRKKR